MAVLLLNHVLLGLLDDLGQLNISKATGGSTTTIVDSNIAAKSKDNVWRDGTAIVVHDAGGAGAAPEGQFFRVSAYANQTGTFTLDGTATAAIASGDFYGYSSQYFPLAQMIQAVNDGLRLLGDMDLVDTTTLTTVAAQTEYTSALVWNRAPPKRIDIQTLTSSSLDHGWQQLFDWEWVQAAPGTTGKIIFRDYLPASRSLRVFYRDRHPGVYLYSDPIDESVPPETAVAAAVVKALEWQNSRLGGADPFLVQRQAKAEQDLANLLAQQPAPRTTVSPKLFIIGQQNLRDVFRVPPTS